MTAGSCIYKDGYKVDRDLTPKYANHSVVVFNRQISGCSMLNKSHQMSVICYCPGALKHTINTSRGSVEWHTLVYGITQNRFYYHRVNLSLSRTTKTLFT